MKSKYNPSDKLAIALACIAGVLAIILFLTEKSPVVVVLMLVLMVLLCVYPILHFVGSSRLGGLLFLRTFIAAVFLGWGVWPKKLTVNQETAKSTVESGQTTSVDRNHGVTDFVSAVPKRHGTIEKADAKVRKGAFKAISPGQEQRNTEGTNVQQQSFGNSSPNISQYAPPV